MKTTIILALTAITLCCAALADAPSPDVLSQRYLWTWDHRMDWAGTGRGGNVMGGGTYSKPPEEFLADYRALIDYMVEHTSFNAVIIWGFLRDEHGGVEASQELCRYAKQKGIRIIPGVGTSGYEGYYFRGNHQFNVTTWLKQHPELRAVGADGRPHSALCPTRPENVQWLNDGCRWLFETFDIGGINFEIGDFFVCHCDDCTRARAAIPGDAPDHFKDMALSTAPVARLAHEISPDAWLSYATYTGFTPEIAATPPSWVKLIPDDIICQWTLTGMLSDIAWPPGIRPPTKRNIGYLHWGNKSTHSVEHVFVSRIQDVCRRAAEAGFEGLVTYGEDPPTTFSMRVFYDAWSYFLDHPASTVDDFGREHLAGWFDSEAEAARMLEILAVLERDGLTRATLPETISHAQKALQTSANEKGKVTWKEFVSFLTDALAKIEAADRIIEDPQEVAAAMRDGFRVAQDSAVTLVLPELTGDTLELRVRVDYRGENGILPVMKLTLNDTVLGPERAIDRPAQIHTPNHDGYPSLDAFDTRKGAWRVKYDEDFELSPDTGQKYFTQDYDPLFRFRIGDLRRDAGNRLRIDNLETRFRPSDQGVLVLGYVHSE